MYAEPWPLQLRFSSPERQFLRVVAQSLLQSTVRYDDIECSQTPLDSSARIANWHRNLPFLFHFPVPVSFLAPRRPPTGGEPFKHRQLEIRSQTWSSYQIDSYVRVIARFDERSVVQSPLRSEYFGHQNAVTELRCSAETDIEARDALAVVQSDGAINWYPHCIFRSSCALDVNNFPFDEQNCNMWFGSWTYTSQEIDLRVSAGRRSLKC